MKAGTNVVQPDPRDSAAVWMDLAESDPARRFKMWRSTIVEKKWGLTAHFSPDGIHWSAPVARTGPAGDRSTVFWNPFRKVWVYSMRGAVPGSARTRTYWEVKDVAAGPYWTAENQLAHWVGSDRLDPQREDLQVTPQLYNLDATAYESLMVGFFTVWRGDKNIPAGRPKPNSVWLGFSRDGFHWDRPDRRAFIPVSEKQGDWNWGNVQSAGGCCLVVGDKLWFYYSGRAGGTTKRDGGGATGLAFLRRDGFASMNAGDTEGTLTTRPLKFSGGHLFVNAAVAAGELRAEVLGADGKAIAPFTAENCIPLKVDKTIAEVTWKGGGDLAKLAGQPAKVRFHLRNGALFSFWVTPDASGASRGYVAAGGPGFTGPVDTVGTKR